MQYLYVAFRRSGINTFKIASDKPLTIITQIKNILFDMGYVNGGLNIKLITDEDYRIWEVTGGSSTDMSFIITERYGVLK